jgi:sec-independent protein translocase protein TatC
MSEPARAPLVAHLEEFRSRLLKVLAMFAVAAIGVYCVAPYLYQFLMAPLAHAFPDPASRRMIYTGLTEAFFTYLKLACFGGFVLSFPVLAWQLYRFIAPGLYAQERRMVVPFLVAAPVLFFSGAALAYYVILPAAWHFFLGFEMAPTAGSMAIQLEARVSEYLDLVMHIILAFGLSFQLPVVLVLLVKAGVLSAQGLAKSRRFAIVGVVAFAGVVTPPDVFSQLALAVPMLGLYELSIVAARWMQPKAEPELALDAGQ